MFTGKHAEASDVILMEMGDTRILILFSHLGINFAIAWQ
jgi:hypothetical protein